MIDRYSQWILNHRWFVIIVSIVFIAFLGGGVTSLKFDNDYRSFFKKNNPQLIAFENLQDTYTKNDNILIALAPKDGNVFTEKTLLAIKDITKRAWQVKHSIRVDSITNFQHTKANGDDLIVADLVGDAPFSQKELDNIKQIALKEPQLLYHLVSKQAHVAAVNITLEIPKNASGEVAISVSEARQIKAYIQKTYPDIDVYLTGILMLDNAFPEASKYDMSHLVPLALVMIMLTILLMLRGIYATLVTLTVVILSVIGAMGSIGWLGFKLTPPLMSVPTIILTLAIADCVHLLSNWIQLRRKGNHKLNAMKQSMKINAMPIFLTSITTAVGFLSLNFSDTPPFRNLGTIAALGVIYAWFLSMTLLPALVTLLPSKVKEKDSQSSQKMIEFANFVIVQRKRLFFIMGGLIVILLAAIPRNELNDIYVKYFDERIEFRTDTDFIVKNMTGVYTLDFSLDSKEESGISKPDFQKDVDAFSAWLRAQPEVIYVNTITDTMKRLNKNLHADNEDYFKLPEERNLAAQYLLLYEMSLPYGLDLNNQVDINKQSTRLSVVLETLSTKQVLALEKRIQEWMATNTPKIQAWGASPTLMFAHIGYRNIVSLLTGTLVALLVISLILMVALKSWRYGLLSLIPNLVPAGMAFGLWALIDGQVGLSLSVVTAMTLGIVVDDTIHFLSKYLRARREEGLSAEDALRYAFSTVGIALIITSVALCAGFLILASSSFSLNANMGLLVSIVILFALMADFLFLPGLLIKLDKWLNPSNTDATASVLEKEKKDLLTN